MVVGNSKAAPKEKNVKITKIVKTSSVTNTSNMENKEKTIEEEKILKSKSGWGTDSLKIKISNPTISSNL